MAKPVKKNIDFENIPEDICNLLPESYEELNNFYQVQDTLAYTKAQLGGYFHKYFPRSYTETVSIVNHLFKTSENYRDIFSTKRHISILDIGSGIGGNLIGMLKFISATFPEVQSVLIDSIDGNKTALEYQEYIIKKINLNFTVTLNHIHHVFFPQTIIEDLKNLRPEHDSYDIVMSSKFINELYRKNSDTTGVYSDFIKYGGDVLKQDGFLMITELTDILSRHGYFNQVFNRETNAYYNTCSAPLTQVFPIQCYLWRESCEDGENCFVQHQFLSGKAKVFTQIFCQASLGNNFYNERYLNARRSAPIRIKNTRYSSGHFCYQGKLCDTDV